jgi:hypothetical protein
VAAAAAAAAVETVLQAEEDNTHPSYSSDEKAIDCPVHPGIRLWCHGPERS